MKKDRVQLCGVPGFICSIGVALWILDKDGNYNVIRPGDVCTMRSTSKEQIPNALVGMVANGGLFFYFFKNVFANLNDDDLDSRVGYVSLKAILEYNEWVSPRILWLSCFQPVY